MERGNMQRLQQYCLVLLIFQSAVKAFAPSYRQTLMSQTRTSRGGSSSIFTATALHAAGLDETELKAELTGYLRKREEENADEAAKA